MIRDTSFEAYQELQHTGKAESARGRVLRCVIENRYPQTRAEISILTGMPINSVCGRVKELIDAGVLNDEAMKICPVSGNRVHAVDRVMYEDSQLPLF